MNREIDSDCQRRSTCRLCDGGQLEKVLSLTPTPPANAFVTPERADEPQAVFPLELFFCQDCCHIQLLDVVDPAVLFEDYVYVSGTSPVFVRHFEEYAKALRQEFEPPDGCLVVDIGSNDGTLLKFFKEAGFSVLGVDPAREIAREASERGIETVPAFFTRELACRFRAERGEVSIVTANNVFAHADDLGNIVEGVRDFLADDGVFAFEVSYLRDVYENTLFDTVYHEHLSYHTVKPLVAFFAKHGMQLIAAHRVNTHGGSLRGIAQHAGGPHAVDDSVEQLISEEEALGLDKADTFVEFGTRIDTLRDELSGLLRELKAAGHSIAGYGAPAKATTLMFHFGLGPDVIDFIVDDSPLKQGLFSPGLHIPVLPSSVLAERRPDYLLILAWNFAEPIMRNNSDYADKGGRFIVPIPQLKIVAGDQTSH